MQVLRLDVVTPDVVLDEVNQMKKEKTADQSRLFALMQTKAKLEKMEYTEDKLKELCTRIAPELENCRGQDKKDAFAYLGLEITATTDGADVRGFLDLNLLTTGQTSALLREYSCPNQPA